MKTVSVKGTAPGAENYELDDGRIVRVILKVKTPEEKFATADHLEVELTAYEITKEGAFVVDDVYGEPVVYRTESTQLPLAPFRAGLDTAKPGWVRQELPEPGPEREAILEGAKKLKKLPATGEDGAELSVDGELYAWSSGAYEQLRRTLAQKLAPVTALEPSESTAELVASLRP